MITNNLNNALTSPARIIKGKVELYAGSTLLNTFSADDYLKSIDIVRDGEENKFFGFGICHKATIHLLDKDRLINIDDTHTMKVYLGTDSSFVDPYPVFYVKEVSRQENTNELTIVAYDKIQSAQKYTVSELGLQAPYTIGTVADKIAGKLGVQIYKPSLSAFNISYETGANFDGAENLRETLTAIAEATQTIYYLNYNNVLVFKRLSNDSPVALQIKKDDYFTLNVKDERVLGGIATTTELGENIIETSPTVEGITQAIHENPFLDSREDITNLLNQFVTDMAGFKITQFNLDWRGNFCLEIGDKISIENKDGSYTTSYVFNDSISYKGGLKEKTGWASSADAIEGNSSTLGAKLKQTYAKVDKVNKEITMVASQVDEFSSEIAQIKIDTDAVVATVSEVTESVNNMEEEVSGYSSSIAQLRLESNSIISSVSQINQDMNDMSAKVESAITSETVDIKIQEAIGTGVSSVTTETGFTFNKDGLTITRNDSPIETQITENGLSIYNEDQEVLKVNDQGVLAEDLKATTYLIVSDSRFEDYDGRTGCFWIG